MNRRAIVAAVGLVTILVVGIACGNGQAADTPGPAVPPAAAVVAPAATGPAAPPILSAGFPAARPATPPVAPVGAPAPTGIQGREVPVLEPAPMPASVAVGPAPSVFSGGSGPQLLQAGGSQAGIWVTGNGSLSLEPDLALVNIGVEATAKTVAEARDQAATAMAAILIAAKAHGLDDKDVQTRSFNIWPQYEYPEVVELGQRTRKQVLVGYRVSNSASIKIRNLGDVGQIIDDVADAGGDLTRINGVSFTVEDPKPFMTGLRQAAVEDALAKAQQFADLTGVAVGRLVLISEAGGGVPMPQSGGMVVMEARAVAAPPTSISGGELELRLNVQAVFEIQ